VVSTQGNFRVEIETQMRLIFLPFDIEVLPGPNFPSPASSLHSRSTKDERRHFFQNQDLEYSFYQLYIKISFITSTPQPKGRSFPTKKKKMPPRRGPKKRLYKVK
jgi:hypothetical protein